MPAIEVVYDSQKLESRLEDLEPGEVFVHVLNDGTFIRLDDRDTVDFIACVDLTNWKIVYYGPACQVYPVPGKLTVGRFV